MKPSSHENYMAEFRVLLRKVEECRTYARDAARRPDVSVRSGDHSVFPRSSMSGEPKRENRP